MLKCAEVGPGRYRIDKIHPITGKRMVRTGKNELALLTWGKLVDDTRDRHRAGLISNDEACQLLLVQDAQRFTVQEAWEEWFPKITHPGTRRAYAAAWEQRLRQPFGALSVQEVSETRLHKWFEEQSGLVTARGAPPSVKTLDNAWQCLKACLRYQQNKRLTAMPWGSFSIKVKKHLDLPTEREALRSWDEVERLIRCAADEDTKRIGRGRGVKYGDLGVRVAFLLMTGLRAGEAGAIGNDDIETRTGIPHLNVRHQVVRHWRRDNPEWDRPQTSPKNGRALIPIHPDVLQLIKYQQENLRRQGWFREDGPLFPGKKGEWRDHPRFVTPERMRELVRKAVPEADAEKFVTHSTRHSFSTVVSVALEGDEKAAMRLTRHKDADTFRGYRHLAGRGLQENPLPRLADVPRPIMPPAQLPPHADESEPERPRGLAALVEVTPAHAQAFEEQQRAARKAAQAEIAARYKPSNITDNETAWRHWTAAGRPGERPHQVTAAMVAAYDRTRKDVLRNQQTGRRTVQKGQRSWEQIARAELATQRPPADAAAVHREVQRLVNLNSGRSLPPPPGNLYTVPSEWEARKRGRASRKAVLANWGGFLKARDARALRTGECTDEPDGKVRLMPTVGEVPRQEEQADDQAQESAAYDE